MPRREYEDHTSPGTQTASKSMNGRGDWPWEGENVVCTCWWDRRLLLLECMWLMTLQYVYWQKCMVLKEANDQTLQSSDGVNVLSSATVRSHGVTGCHSPTSLEYQMQPSVCKKIQPGGCYTVYSCQLGGNCICWINWSNHTAPESLVYNL